MSSLSRLSRRNRGLRAAWAGLIALVATGAGCHALSPQTADPLTAAQRNDAAVAASQPASAQHAQLVQVEFRPEGGKPERKAVPIEGEMHVQDVMMKAGAYRRFSRVRMELLRKTPAGNATKMQISYDRNSQKIDPQTDYFVHPGDVLVVNEDSSSVFTDMLKSVGLPLDSPAMKHVMTGG